MARRRIDYTIGGFMELRIGRVIEIYPEEGKVKVTFEDINNSSLALPMLTMNNEYMMPSIGTRVITAHFDSGSSKGVVLGTYYYDGNKPSASAGFRKDFGKGAYISSDEDVTIGAKNDIDFRAGSTLISIKTIIQEINQIKNDLKEMNDKLNDIEKTENENTDKIKNIEEQVAKLDNSAKIAALEKRIETLEKKGG